MNKQVHPAIVGLQAQLFYPNEETIQQDALVALEYLQELHHEINELRQVVEMLLDGYELDLVVGMKTDIERWRDAMQAILELLEDGSDGPNTAPVDKY